MMNAWFRQKGRSATRWKPFPIRTAPKKCLLLWRGGGGGSSRAQLLKLSVLCFLFLQDISGHMPVNGMVPEVVHVGRYGPRGVRGVSVCLSLVLLRAMQPGEGANLGWNLLTYSSNLAQLRGWPLCVRWDPTKFYRSGDVFFLDIPRECKGTDTHCCLFLCVFCGVCIVCSFSSITHLCLGVWLHRCSLSV